MDYVTIKEERKALADLLNTIEALNGYAYWPDQIQTPAGLVRPVTRTEPVMNDLPVRSYEIELLHLAGDQESSQELLDEYLEEQGPKSIKELLEVDPTLGGLVGNLIFMGWRDYGGRRTEAASFIGAIIMVDLYPRSSY